MENNFRRFLMLVTIFTGTFYTSCKGEEKLEKPSCECINYDNAYMNCSCCPPDVTTDYNYRIDYGWSGLSSMKQCEENWTSDAFIRCDCLFCGNIRDVSHSHYKVCTEMPGDSKPFSINRSYHLNVSVVKNFVISNANFKFDALSVLKPSPVQILDKKSFLSTNNEVLLKLELKPSDYMKKDDLTYLISWKKDGDATFQNASTNETDITLGQSLAPNSLYDVIVKCHPKQGGYWSESTAISIRTAERCFERAPALLVNYEADYAKCQKSSNDACVQITVFWKHRYPDILSANCTKYALEITGSSGSFSEIVSCNAVMAELEKPLYNGQTYNVTLRTFSAKCASPPSFLIIQPAMVVSAHGQELDAKIVRQNSSVTVYISWSSETAPPAKYGIFYCQTGIDSRCQGHVNEKIIDRQPGNQTTFEMNDPGLDFVYNVFPYWDDGRADLSSLWLCAFNYCGTLFKPQITHADIGKDSVTIKVFEIYDKQCTSQSNRSLPVLFEIRVKSSEDEEVFSKTLHSFGPFSTKVSSLKPNSVYTTSVRSVGGCDQIQNTEKFTTAEKDKANVIAIIFGVILSISLLLGCVGFVWWCGKHMRAKKSLLEKHRSRLRALSSVSATTMEDYTQRWVENLPTSDAEDYGEIDGVEPNGDAADDVERVTDGQRPSAESDKPKSDEKKCPKVLAKWHNKWNNMICCSSKPSPTNDGYEPGDNSQRTPLTDPELGMPINESGHGEGKAETDLTELQSLTKEKEEMPMGDSGCIQGSSNGKASDPSQENTATKDEGSSQGKSSSVQNSEPESSPITQTVFPTHDENVKPKLNTDKYSADSYSPSQASSDKEGHAKDSGPTSGSGLPLYTQCAGDSNYQKAPQANDYNKLPANDYNKLPNPSVSDELTNDDSGSDDYSESESPFLAVIPSLAGGPINNVI